jgi:hypothetical protein
MLCHVVQQRGCFLCLPVHSRAATAPCSYPQHVSIACSNLAPGMAINLQATGWRAPRCRRSASRLTPTATVGVAGSSAAMRTACSGRGLEPLRARRAAPRRCCSLS